MDEISKDPRFAHVPRDPKFRRIPRSERKVKIDKRFQSMFRDKRFKVTYTIDKRGRPLQKSSAEDLEKYYDLSSGSEAEAAECVSTETSERLPKKLKKKVKKKEPQKLVEEEGDEPEDEEEDDDDQEASEVTDKAIEENEEQLNLRRKNESTQLNKKIKKKLKDLTVDYARGEGVLLSDSSSEEETSEESEEDEGIEHMWGELDREAETTDEVTSRFAACNMDWDRIRAVDLMVLFNSFLPPGGLIHSVAIYPSDFGLQRMKEEELKGPIELVDVKNSEEQSGDDEEEGSEFRREKLRQYQLNRLKYYYAVIVCDSPESANKIYTECDGHEYESTATKLDLRFIPGDMEFDQEPREVCDRLPDMSKYQPRSFTTTALQQVKVECTWDETKLDRQEITRKINSGKIDDIDENDIKAYLASGTSDEESEVEEKNDEDGDDGRDPLEKYKSLLKSIEQQEDEKKKREGELEFTWGLGTKDKAEKLVQEKLKKSEQLTPFEQYLEKRKERKKAKREEKRKQKSNDDGSDSESVPSDVDLSDPYFAEELKNAKPKEKKKVKPQRDEDDEEVQQRAELELLLADKEEEEQKHHFDMKRIEESELLTKSKRKRLSKKKRELKESAAEDSFEVDVKDPRFGALFTSHHFNIDPADPHYRRTRGTEALISEKLKRRADGDVSEEAPAKQSRCDKKDKMSAELAALVKSVKRNTKNISRPIK